MGFWHSKKSMGLVERMYNGKYEVKLYTHELLFMLQDSQKRIRNPCFID